jgi:hypothetical protein
MNDIVNEPAGNLGKIIVTHIVKLVVHAWDNPGDSVQHVTETSMECLFHPDFHNPNSALQKEMVSKEKGLTELALTLPYSSLICINGYRSTQLENMTSCLVYRRRVCGIIPMFDARETILVVQPWRLEPLATERR